MKKIKTVNISLPEEVLEEFDKLAKKMHWNRSTLIRLSIESFIKNYYLGSLYPRKEK